VDRVYGVRLMSLRHSESTRTLDLKNSGRIGFNPLTGRTCCYWVGGVGLHLVTHLTRGRLAGLSWAVLRFARKRAGQLRLGRAGLRRSGRGKRLAGPDSVSSRVSAHSQNRIENSFSFSKSVYNLQTNLNSIQI
jgi:hypothetical protein